MTHVSMAVRGLRFDNKFKNKSRGNGFLGYGNENMDGLNELNRDPRAKASKSIRIGKGRHRRIL